MPNTDTTVIKNGRRLREWVIFGITICGLITGGAIAWENAQNKVERVDDDLKNYIENNERNTTKAITTIADCLLDVKRNGTALSRANQIAIVQIQSDVTYTKEAVRRVENKLDNISKKITE